MIQRLQKIVDFIVYYIDIHEWIFVAKGLISCQQQQRKIVQFELFSLSYVNQCNYKALNSHR